ncbi:SurA N-terminal domain-containing protein [Kitasatospora sp. NPDC049285]|uniref:SurA N-terminal domain-containing protein n=1 Tax=Kitasatospora sp. NPDC049285 TaxID=3157096 RepID=UPI0034228F8D
MIRTSSARTRRLRTAVGVALAAAALTACGTATPHQGAAAVVGGERITVAQVESRVAAVRAGMGPQTGAKSNEPAGLARHAVSDLILDKVIARALVDRQLAISQSEIDAARAADTRTVGGEDRLAQLLLSRQGVPAAGIDGYYRQQLGIVKLAGGQDPESSSGDAAIRKALATAGTALHIEVNPRYGAWDPAQIALTETTEDWLPKNAQPL